MVDLQSSREAGYGIEVGVARHGGAWAVGGGSPRPTGHGPANSENSQCPGSRSILAEIDQVLQHTFTFCYSEAKLRDLQCSSATFTSR